MASAPSGDVTRAARPPCGRVSTMLANAASTSASPKAACGGPRRAVRDHPGEAGCCGGRRARYRSLAKTRLDHACMACALNLIRLHAYWTGTALDRQRTSHLARLELDLAA